jgi:hypothetical protein
MSCSHSQNEKREQQHYSSTHDADTASVILTRHGNGAQHTIRLMSISYVHTIVQCELHVGVHAPYGCMRHVRLL